MKTQVDYSDDDPLSEKVLSNVSPGEHMVIKEVESEKE